jgi:hypothetical protein
MRLMRIVGFTRLAYNRIDRAIAALEMLSASAEKINGQLNRVGTIERTRLPQQYRVRKLIHDWESLFHALEGSHVSDTARERLVRMVEAEIHAALDEQAGIRR